MLKSQRSFIIKFSNTRKSDIENIVVHSPSESAFVKTVDVLPKYFDGVSNWPKSTTLKCWHCDDTPQLYPAFIPVNMTRLTKIENGEQKFVDTCETIGCFCTWNCAVRFAQLYFPRQEACGYINMMPLFESKFTGKPPRIIIPPAPNKTIKMQYCGPDGKTDQQYRMLVAKIDSSYS